MNKKCVKKTFPGPHHMWHMGGHPNPVDGERRQNPVWVNMNHEKDVSIQGHCEHEKGSEKTQEFY
jgi:hypothetical protein